ncbi:GNAT family N-acetyltransferase [Candidatus Pacearchaeota archaeon]|nr:GNAT family N-acetyltransferase [Candidatus Pacearchaeota archaeon]
MKFKDTLEGERIVLKKSVPTMELATKVFEAVDADREHLQPWFPWVTPTKRVEDSLKYLFSVEDEGKKSKKVEYGIYIDGEYAGNIGFFGIDDKNKSGEIGYWISSRFVRKGYITEAIKTLEREVFENLGLNRIVIKCDERNEASFGVAKKCGYQFEGKLREDSHSEHFGDLRNTMLFSKLKSEYK